MLPDAETAGRLLGRPEGLGTGETLIWVDLGADEVLAFDPLGPGWNTGDESPRAPGGEAADEPQPARKRASTAATTPVRRTPADFSVSTEPPRAP